MGLLSRTQAKVRYSRSKVSCFSFLKKNALLASLQNRYVNFAPPVSGRSTTIDSTNCVAVMNSCPRSFVMLSMKKFADQLPNRKPADTSSLVIGCWKKSVNCPLS